MRAPRGTSSLSVLAALPWHLRHTAGCRPCVPPDAACHRLAAITPADRARAGPAILPALQS
jgi:hypothetical protein